MNKKFIAFWIMVYMYFAMAVTGMSQQTNTTKIIALPQIMKPNAIHVDAQHVYISEGTTVHIYRRKDFKLLKSFGSSGEGPQEFKPFDGPYPIVLVIKPNILVIYSVAKSSYYKKDGTFIKEKREKGDKTYFVVGKNYLGTEMVSGNKERDYLVQYLYDSHYKKIKEIVRMVMPIQFDKKEWYFFIQAFYPRFLGEHFYYVNGTDFQIDVFNFRGEKISVIKHDYKRVKITEKHINAAHEWFRTRHPNKMMYDKFKSWFKFPENFPAIKSFRVAGDHIYAQTYKRKRNLVEFIIFTLKGKFVKTLWLPVCPLNITEDCPYTFKDGKFYHLMDDIEKEEWTLHIIPLE